MRNDLPAVHTSDRYRYITALADKIDLDPHTTLTEAIDDLVPDADAIAIQAGEARLVVDQAYPDNHQQPDAADVSDQAPDDAAHDLYPTRHTPEGINR